MALREPSPYEGLSLLDDATLRLAARGIAAELFLRGGPELSLAYEPTTGRTLESRGERLRATCRVWRDGLCASASADVDSVEDLLSLADTARERAVHGLPTPLPGPHFHETHTPQPVLSRERAVAMARAVTEPFAGRAGCFQAVLIRQALAWTAVASTAGTRALDIHPSEQLLVRLETGQGALVDGVAGALTEQPLDVTPAMSRLRSGCEALASPGGPPEPALPWVLSPAAAAPLVAGLGWLLSGETLQRMPDIARSLGQPLFPSMLTLVDEPGIRHMDDEGEPAAPLTLVEQGRLRALLHSSRTAQALGAKPNGRGLRPSDGGEPVSQAFSLRVVSGNGVPPRDRNHFVTRLETFTQMARPGRITLILAGWVVRCGERTRRIAPLEVELPLVETFTRLRAVCSDTAHLPASEGGATPTLVFEPRLSVPRQAY